MKTTLDFLKKDDELGESRSIARGQLALSFSKKRSRIRKARERVRARAVGRALLDVISPTDRKGRKDELLSSDDLYR